MSFRKSASAADHRTRFSLFLTDLYGSKMFFLNSGPYDPSASVVNRCPRPGRSCGGTDDGHGESIITLGRIELVNHIK
jgi:hypothetical protein